MNIVGILLITIAVLAAIDVVMYCSERGGQALGERF